MTSDLTTLRRDWEQHGADDPLWAVLTADGKQGNRWNPDEFFATGREDWQKAVERMVPILAKTPYALRTSGTALDIGCGVGRVTQALAGTFANAIGIDISRPMVEGARRFNIHGERVRYLVGPGDSLAGIPDQSIDFVWSFIALQHTPQVYQLRYLAEIGRVLTPGGLAHFQIPTRGHHWKVRLRRFLKALAPGLAERFQRLVSRNHARIQMHPLSPTIVRQTLKANGVEIIAETPDDCALPWYESVFYTAVKH